LTPAKRDPGPAGELQLAFRGDARWQVIERIGDVVLGLLGSLWPEFVHVSVFPAPASASTGSTHRQPARPRQPSLTLNCATLTRDALAGTLDGDLPRQGHRRLSGGRGADADVMRSYPIHRAPAIAPLPLTAGYQEVEAGHDDGVRIIEMLKRLGE
jgi:hypothetical protein